MHERSTSKAEVSGRDQEETLGVSRGGVEVVGKKEVYEAQTVLQRAKLNAAEQ